MTNVETVQVQEVPFLWDPIQYPDPMGYAENIFNGLAFTEKELQDKFAMEVDEMILKMNNSFKVENGADPKLVLSNVQAKLIQIVKSILYEGQVYKNRAFAKKYLKHLKDQK